MKVHRSTKPLVMLLVLLLFAVGIATPYVYAAEEQESTDKIQITYYYFSSCESCEDGQNFLNSLQGQIEDAISPDEYEFHLRMCLKKTFIMNSWSAPRTWRRTSLLHLPPCWK